MQKSNPRISFGRYRILEGKTGYELWEGAWKDGYSKVADISIKRGILIILREYQKVPKVYIRKLQEQINEQGFPNRRQS